MTDRLMTCDSIDELLSGYLEGDMPADEAAAVDAHVSVCARCKALLCDIGGIREYAGSLAALTPSVDLWKGISSRIATPVVVIGGRKARRYSAPLWMAAAASLLIVGSSSLTYWFIRSGTPSSATVVLKSPASVATDLETRTAVARPDPTSVRLAESENDAPAVTERVARSGTHESARKGARFVSGESQRLFAPDTVFGSEIARLQRIVRAKRSELDPRTVQIVQTNLKLIDEAIRSSRNALARDPASGFLTQQLTRALDSKVELLRTVASIPSST